MTSGPSAAVAAAMTQYAQPAQSADKLEAARNLVRAAREGECEVADLEERLSELKARNRKRLFEEIPDLFDELGIPRLDLDAAGNMPAVSCEVRPYYHANIAANWPTHRRAAAFQALVAEGAGDLVKVELIARFGRGRQEEVTQARATLDGAGIEYDERMVVDWNTLTAWLREQVEKKKRMPQLEPIGAVVGRQARIKVRT
jgi:hypothetical protein